MLAKILKVFIVFGQIIDLVKLAWNKTSEWRAQKKKAKRDAIIKQLDLARKEGDDEKIRKLHIALNKLS